MPHLRVDASYRNTNNWNLPVDEFGKFFRFADGRGIKNIGGFRPKSKASGSTRITDCCFCVLVTNLGETEWPDALNSETGAFIYYGDNRSPGEIVNRTHVGGNSLLESVFAKVHSGQRQGIPPFLCFQSFGAAEGMYMRFLGLAAPGGPAASGLEDLVAVWRIKGNERFQNYRALFSILAADTVSHEWLEDLVRGVAPAESSHCPLAWKVWVNRGRYDLLKCERTVRARTKEEQAPRCARESAVLSALCSSLTPRQFEFAAAALVTMMDERFVNLQVTPAVRDGGRDVIAQYRVGHDLHQILLSASVEAKLWNPRQAVGVKPMMRLLSRLKHRDMGVFITTSFFERQVQQELIEDKQPVILVSGGDIARVLISRDIEGEALVRWLARFTSEAPPTDPTHGRIEFELTDGA
ncbi:restriction endonuclease [Achromobacter xylosoxidans]|uniref:restriction endonuclease n=1 Tax=Alcaligenes xylosoxydans xylosoxydans TaxID=85698 RepID=UPI00204186B6|nr:restriction endonuclease [Achromobacter xylosoxidans]MCM2574437.1 restriction endonuclease [Achromobacter xylosoxidans]